MHNYDVFIEMGLMTELIHVLQVDVIDGVVSVRERCMPAAMWA